MSAAAPAVSSSIVATVDLDATRSPLDQKLYRHITLSNGVQATLVQDVMAMMHQQDDRPRDPGTDDDDDEVMSDVNRDGDVDDGMNSSTEDDHDAESIRSAACAVLVGAGSSSDPPEHAGSAHFLEHLLFMGSEEYPEENGYESLITMAGGSDNAFTDWHHTVYSFDLANQQSLPKVLDRLAHFFVHPLMLETAVDRELKAIESEFQLNRNSDSVRSEQLMLALHESNGDSLSNEISYGSFAWGNIKSLGNSYTALRPWFEQHYCASRIRVVIQAAYSLDDLQNMVLEGYGAIPRRITSELPPPKTSVASSLSNLLVRIVPVKERHHVAISWKIPCQTTKWKTRSVDIIAHLLGHEASGSVYAYLQSHAMATSCMAGVEDEGNPNTFSVAFDVTDVAHWPLVVKAVMAYLELLRRKGVPPYIFTELKHVAQLSYQYGDERSPEETVEMLADNMAPAKAMEVNHLLSGSSLYLEYDEAEVVMLLKDYLTLENCNVSVTSSAYGSIAEYENNHVEHDKLIIHDPPKELQGKPSSTPQQEPWFGTYFWCNRIPTSVLEQWASADPESYEMHLPLSNPFVPKALELKPVAADDANHPLLHAALKICLVIGKQKQWFPFTVIRYDSKRNAILVCCPESNGSDEEDTWYTLDDPIETIEDEFYDGGTLNRRQTTFRIVSRCPVGVKMAAHPSSDDYPPIPAASRRIPRQIVNTAVLKLWWLQDRTFQRPLVDLRIELVCTRVNESAFHRAVADLMAERASDFLTETCYLAELCELDSSLEALSTGFSFRFHGFDDRLLNLVEPVLSCLLSFRDDVPSTAHSVFEETRLKACKDKLERRYKNTGMNGASLVDNIRIQAIRTNSFSANQKLKAIESATVDKLRKAAADILSVFSAESLLHGNCVKSDALQVRDVILRLVGTDSKGLSTKKYPSQSVYRIPLSKEISSVTLPSKNLEEPNTTCDVYFQIAKDSLHDRVVMDLLLHMMDEPFYDQIRTKDQFGYDVNCDVRWSFGIIGCIFHITTNVKSAKAAMERINTFLVDFRTSLLEMSIDDFEDYRIGLASQKLETFSSLSEESDCLWAEIHNGRFEWEAYRNEVVYLRGLTKEDTLDAFD